MPSALISPNELRWLLTSRLIVVMVVSVTNTIINVENMYDMRYMLAVLAWNFEISVLASRPCTLTAALPSVSRTERAMQPVSQPGSALTAMLLMRSKVTGSDARLVYAYP